MSTLRCYQGDLEDDMGEEPSDASLSGWFHVICSELHRRKLMGFMLIDETGRTVIEAGERPMPDPE